MKPLPHPSCPRSRDLAFASLALLCLGGAAQTAPPPGAPAPGADADRVIVSPDPPRPPSKHRRITLVRPTHPTPPPSRPQRPVNALR